MNLHLPLKNKWFGMTKSRIKLEDYREINEYWIKRIVRKDYIRPTGDFHFEILRDRLLLNVGLPAEGFKYFFNEFDCNILTLGYPKSTNADRILKLEHKGIEIRTGNVEWGAEPDKVYFVIMHGEVIE